jgi:hypothetical protein
MFRAYHAAFHVNLARGSHYVYNLEA